jgi:hypothetical protein
LNVINYRGELTTVIYDIQFIGICRVVLAVFFL